MHTWKQDKFGMFDHFSTDLLSNEINGISEDGYVTRNQEDIIEMSEEKIDHKNLLMLELRQSDWYILPMSYEPLWTQ